MIVHGIKLNKETYFGSQANSLSHKNENKNPNSPSENLNEALLNNKKVKRKDVSTSENLDQALEDEGIDLPTIVPPLQETSSLLIK